MLADSFGCRVDCIELSPDFCTGAAMLNRLTGLEALVGIHKGSVFESGFPDNSFDVAWMQNVGMNIEDKRKLYSEIRRVLKPGGRFAFQEMTAGDEESSYFPLPWATAPGDHFLISAEEMQQTLNECGFVAEYFEDVSETQFQPPESAPQESVGQVQLSMSVYVDDLVTKGKNAQRSLLDDQVCFYRGVFRAI